MGQIEHEFFAVVPPGFEEICARELAALHCSGVTVLAGGVTFRGGLKELYLVNLWLRSASRVLVRVGEISARDFPTLFKRLVRLPWGRFVRPGDSCKVRVHSSASRLVHSGRLAATCRAAIERALGADAEDGHPEQTVYLRLRRNRCLVSIDSSGAHLHQRGYRTLAVAAPLRENLAAGCLLALDYEGEQPLRDLMTGSGTLAIEAALIALRRAPGRDRRFAFMDWPGYRDGLWQELLRAARRGEKSAPEKSIVGCDTNPRAIDAARGNLETAGLHGLVEFHCLDMQACPIAAQPGLLICNPPYGDRIGKNAALSGLYHRLGEFVRRDLPHWQGAFICPEQGLIRQTGLPLQTRVRFANGGLQVALMSMVPPIVQHGKND